MNYSNVIELFDALDSPEQGKQVYGRFDVGAKTYFEVIETIKKLHTIFKSKDLKTGDRVILSVDNDFYSSVIFLALLRYGATAVLIDPGVPRDRAVSIIDQARVQGIIMDEHLFEERASTREVELFTLKVGKQRHKKGKIFNRLLKKSPASSGDTASTFPDMLDSVVPDGFYGTFLPDTLAYIIYTSGTTSAPKGVMITHQNLFTHLTTLSKVYELDQHSKLFNILMLYHADGIIQGPLLTAYNQATLIRPFRFEMTNIDKTFNAIYKYKVTHFISVPTVLTFMNQFSEGYEDSFYGDEFKCVISVAAKLETKLWLEFEEKFKVKLVNVFGLTETVSGSLFCGMNESIRKVGTVGKPVDCMAKIVCEDNSEAQANQSGELWLKGEHISPGYFDNPEYTKQVIKDGWLHTGDIAIRDENGFYKITGRIKNVINSGGVNIYPEQITEMINSNPDVLESITLGLVDEFFSEKLVSCIVLSQNKSLSKVSLVDYLRQRLEAHQIPKEIYFVDDLPKGLSGKIKTAEVKSFVLEMQKTLVKEGSYSYQMAVKEAAGKAFNLDISKLSMADNSRTLNGWDSMAHLSFVTALENRFDIRFTPAEIITMNSLSKAEQILKEKSA